MAKDKARKGDETAGDKKGILLETGTNEFEIESTIRNLIYDVDKQRLLYERAKEVTRKNHTLEGSASAFEEVVARALAKSVLLEQ